MKKIISSVILISVVLISCLKSGVSVHIQNSTRSEIKEVILEFTGGKEIISKLPSGVEVSKIVNPTGESSLTVSYSIGDNSYQKNIDVYFEPNYKGDLFLKIKDQGKITWNSQVRLPTF